MNLCRRTALLHTLVSWLTVPITTMSVDRPADTSILALHNTGPTSEYHKPPPGVDYSRNPSVFGKILRGEEPAVILEESAHLLTFQDRSPRAKLHGLIIPKAYLPDVTVLTADDIALLEEMQGTAKALVQKYQPEAYSQQDYILCFHVPPFNSVDHLHLHVLAPASKMAWWYRDVKYQVGTRWCTSFQHVLTSLRRGRKSVRWSFSGGYVGSDGIVR